MWRPHYADGQTKALQEEEDKVRESVEDQDFRVCLRVAWPLVCGCVCGWWWLWCIIFILPSSGYIDSLEVSENTKHQAFTLSFCTCCCFCCCGLCLCDWQIPTYFLMAPVDVSSLKALPGCHGEHTFLLPCPVTEKWYMLLVKHVWTVGIAVKYYPMCQHSENRNPVIFHLAIPASDAWSLSGTD